MAGGLLLSGEVHGLAAGGSVMELLFLSPCIEILASSQKFPLQLLPGPAPEL